MFLTAFHLVVPLLLRPVWTEHFAREENWDHRQFLDSKGSYILSWTVKGDIIVFRIEVATNGWVGFGLSPRGNLLNSDVVIGWAGENRGYLYDFHGNSRGDLFMDKIQSWKLLFANKNKKHTILQFSRRLETCDLQDMRIRNGTHPIIYGYSSTNTVFSHRLYDAVRGFQRRWRSSYLKLLAPMRIIAPIPPDVRTWDVRVDNYHIPANAKTVLYCKFVRAPRLEKEHHVIKVSPIVTSPDVLMYLTLSYCIVNSREEGEAAVNFGSFDCLQQRVPDLYHRCWNYFSAWSRGNKPFVYPAHVGTPLGRNNPQYFLFVSIYWNFSFRKNIIDHSGLRHYYTPHLRPYSSSVLFMGALYPSLDPIPPGQKRFVVSAHASPECLEMAIPKRGIKIFATSFYVQLLGREVKLRHFRGNVELPPIMEDYNADVFHQDFEFLKREVTFLPGDQMTLECSFDSRSRNTTTLGGYYADDESCTAFVFYYPSIAIGRTFGWTTLASTAGVTGMDLTSGLFSVAEISEVGVIPNVNFVNYMKNYKWMQSTMRLVEDSMRFSPKKAFCTTFAERSIKVPYVSYPNWLIPYRRPNQCSNKDFYPSKKF